MGWHLSICVPRRDLIVTFSSFNRKYVLKRIFTAFFRLDLSRTPLKSLWKSHGHGLRSLAASWVSGCDHILHLRRNMALERRTSLRWMDQIGFAWGYQAQTTRSCVTDYFSLTAENLGGTVLPMVFSEFFISKIKTLKFLFSLIPFFV